MVVACKKCFRSHQESWRPAGQLCISDPTGATLDLCDGELAKTLEIPTFAGCRGCIGVIEGADLPFEIKRVYYLYDIPTYEARGSHGHKALQQCFVCIKGSVTIAIDDGLRRCTFDLAEPSRGLLVPPLRWRRLTDFSRDAVVIVLASAPFDRNDYIFDYCEFLSVANSAQADR